MGSRVSGLEMKSLLKKIIFRSAVAKRIVRLLATLHQKFYAYIGLFAVAAKGGVHPKHRIMKYKKWFLDNIEPSWIVVDIGCNSGLMPELLSQKAKFVYGIEINESLIQEADETHYTEYTLE